MRELSRCVHMRGPVRSLHVFAVALTLLVTASACGQEPAGQSVQSSAAPTSSPTPLASPSNARAAVPATCPATVRNSAGAYSFQCSSDWKFLNCEAYTYTWLINPYGLADGCLDEAYGARMMVWSVSGDYTGGPSNMSLGTQQSSRTATIAGIAGTRRTYLVTADSPLGPPNGTVETLYTFVTGGRTLFAFYARYPGDADLAADFDSMITGTLKFSA
jgi:hypothetical protein